MPFHKNEHIELVSRILFRLHFYASLGELLAAVFINFLLHAVGDSTRSQNVNRGMHHQVGKVFIPIRLNGHPVLNLESLPI